MNLQTPGEKTGGFLFVILIPQARYMGLGPPIHMKVPVPVSHTFQRRVRHPKETSTGNE
jgi:hypothetical protein